MERCGVKIRWKHVMLLLTVCFRVSGGQVIDSCDNEKNCTIQLSSSASLQCSVGHMRACNSVQLLKHTQDYSTHKSYPYLSTVSIYKRSYGNNQRNYAFNFSFIVPSADISVEGFRGVLAEFGEAPGYQNNEYYKEPICRFFNFSSSPSVLAETPGTQIEIPYNCIGNGISPSVFHLNLTSVPSWHGLNYVVSWHEQPYHEYDSFYHFYEDSDQRKQTSFWLEQVIAVAVLHEEKIIHVVFQPPRSEADITFLKVSLIRQSRIVKFVQVGLEDTSVTFTDVTPGHYTVTVSPQGGVCDLDSNLCTDVTSKNISLGQRSSTAAASDDTAEDVLVIAGLAGGTGILVLFGILALLIRKYRKNRESEVRAIYLTSMASRELEMRVTSYFCTFLSVALQTSVTFIMPLLHPDRLKVINANSTNHEMETSSSLLPQTSTSHKFFSCYIILQFSYNMKGCKLTNVTSEPDDTVPAKPLSLHGDFKRSSLDIEDILHHIPSKQVYFVTFKQEGDSNDSGIAYTVYEGSEDGMSSEDHITVLNGNVGCSSKNDDVSLCNRTERYTYKCNNQKTKDYELPCDINELYEDLYSQLSSKSVCIFKRAISEIEYWRLAITVFQKAVENQSGNAATHETCDQMSDIITVDESAPNRTRIQDNQHRMSHTLQHSTSHIPDCSSFLNQIGMYQPADSITTMTSGLCVYSKPTLDLYSTITKNESDGLRVVSPNDDDTDRTIYDHNYIIVKSMATNRNDSSSFYDSYSNITEAEIDMKLGWDSGV